MAYMEEFQHLKIQLQEITSATNNFDERNIIGKGGFGKVYKGSLSRYKEQSAVAIKRLDHHYGQGELEFLKEIMMLSRYTHENLITLLGFCNEGGEMILVYEYAYWGSLDRHLNTPDLTWRRRLRICFEAAKALSYLHDPNGEHQRVLHCDIKSANILLGENLNAKVSDFGLAKVGPANQQYTFLITNAIGTPGYCDPLYLETYSLTKESDVYSFGVVLFEVLCGRPCYEYMNNGLLKVLVPRWKQSYEDKKLEEIIFPGLNQIRPSSLEAFSDIAYQCLHKSREERPTMAHVVEKLQKALEFEDCHDVELPKNCKEIISFRSVEELDMLLSKGIILKQGKREFHMLMPNDASLNISTLRITRLNIFNGQLFSLNENGEHCELISSEECVIPTTGEYSFKFDSRFAMGCYYPHKGSFFKIHARPQFLEPQVTYKVNLVCKEFFGENETSKPLYLPLKYKLEGEAKSSVSYFAHGREDGWFMAELYQFTSDTSNIDLQILFEGSAGRYGCSIVVEGIEFQPMEKAEHEVLLEDDQKVEMQHIDWEQKLPNDYEEIIKWSKDGVQWTTKKELYFILCKGFLINNGEEWFSLSDNGKKCYMLASRVALAPDGYWSWLSKSRHIDNFWSSLLLPESRFKEVACDTEDIFSIVCNIKSHLLSPETTYASYLVYKVPENSTITEAPPEVYLNGWQGAPCNWYIFLVNPQIPVITRKADENTHNGKTEAKMKGIPKMRNDGWMEVQVWEFQTGITTEMIPLHLQFQTSTLEWLSPLVVEGVEFRPI